jgi:hypothetical protein
MLNKKEIKMRKLTKKHVLAINKLMIPLINTVAYITEDENDLGMFTMYASDIAYNVNALCAFNVAFDVEALHDNIMRQDTIVREHFYTVLQYIEDNHLINANAFCCR